MKANPYEKINQQLKEDSERIFQSSNLSKDDIQKLKSSAESAKIILTKIEPNDNVDLIQSFLNFVIRACTNCL